MLDRRRRARPCGGLLQRAADVGAASRIEWLGTRDGIVAILRTCTALVSTPRRGSPSRAIFETWDTGAVPIVCAESGGAEIFTAADAGIRYDLQTRRRLRPRSVTHCISTAEEIARWVANGRALLADNCDAKRRGAAISHILRETCSKPGKSSSRHCSGLLALKWLLSAKTDAEAASLR
jgi:hypothetical protein